MPVHGDHSEVKMKGLKNMTLRLHSSGLTFFGRTYFYTAPGDLLVAEEVYDDGTYYTLVVWPWERAKNGFQRFKHIRHN